MDPIPLSAITAAIKSNYGNSRFGHYVARNVADQQTTFDRREARSSLTLVTFHDAAGRMIHESYIPKALSDSEAIAFTARLLAPGNPLKESLKTSTVKRK